MAALRTARSRAGLSREDAAHSMHWSLSKLHRIETGEQGISVNDLKALLSLYGMADEERLGELTQLALGSRMHSWWSSYRDVISRPFGQYLSLEGSASRLRVFHPFLVPSLLHTREYGYELLKVGAGEEHAPALLELRSKRQDRMFNQQEPPEMEFVFGEEALKRPIGSASIMERQCRRLLELMAMPHVSVRIVPLEAGAYPGLIGSFILMSLQGAYEELLFLEGAGSDMVSQDERHVIDPFMQRFETLASVALTEDDTRSLIRHGLETFMRLS